MPKPRLNFTRFTDEDLDNLSQVTEQDILAAHRWIFDSVSPKYKNLVLAEIEPVFPDADSPESQA